MAFPLFEASNFGCSQKNATNGSTCESSEIKTDLISSVSDLEVQLNKTILNASTTKILIRR